MNAKEGVDERRKRKGEEGRQKVRKRQKRCRQVCDLFKELEGNRRAGGPQRGGGGGGGSSSYGDDKECFSPPGYSHGLMGLKPRPVPSTPCHRFQEAKCHPECRRCW